MNDQQATLQDLKSIVKKFIDDRNWTQYHNAKDLSLYITLEAAELLEIFAWIKEQDIQQHVEEKRQAIQEELADIICVLLSFCNRYNIDITKALIEKMAINHQKYPLEKARNTHKKSTEL